MGTYIIVVLKELGFMYKKMPVSKKTYDVHNINQLIDLNGDSINFKVSFTATALHNAPFEFLVVDQDTLDRDEEIQCKKMVGTASATITSDNNTYQDWYIILRSDEPCKIVVQIDLTKLPDNIPQQPQQAAKVPNPYKNPHSNPSNSSVNWKNIIFIAVIVGGIILLYYMFTKQPSEDSSIAPDVAILPVVAPAPVEVPVPVVESVAPEPVAPMRKPAYGFGKKPIDPDLLERLRSLPLR